MADSSQFWGVNGDYAESRLNVNLGHKTTLSEGEKEMDGMVNSDVLKGVVLNGNVV